MSLLLQYSVCGITRAEGSRKALKRDSPRGGTLIHAGKRRCVSTPDAWVHAHATLRTVLDLLGGGSTEPQLLVSPTARCLRRRER